MIGTNNSATTVPEIAEGVKLIVKTIHEKSRRRKSCSWAFSRVKTNPRKSSEWLSTTSTKSLPSLTTAARPSSTSTSATIPATRRHFDQGNHARLPASEPQGLRNLGGGHHADAEGNAQVGVPRPWGILWHSVPAEFPPCNCRASSARRLLIAGTISDTATSTRLHSDSRHPPSPHVRRVVIGPTRSADKPVSFRTDVASRHPPCRLAGLPSDRLRSADKPVSFRTDVASRHPPCRLAGLPSDRLAPPINPFPFGRTSLPVTLLAVWPVCHRTDAMPPINPFPFGRLTYAFASPQPTAVRPVCHRTDAVHR